jgi:signal transduction histidine kinase
MMGMMPHMIGPAEGPQAPPPEGQRPPGMPFMWGHRWGGVRGDPARLFPSLPKDAKVRRFWEGSAFGVAVPAQSFPGVIAVHADADYLLNFRREIGVERVVQDLAKQSGIADVTLVDGDFTVLASSAAAALDTKDPDPLLREAWEARTERSGRRTRPDGSEVYEVVKPFALENTQVGLVRLGLSTESLTQVARQAQRNILLYSLGLLLVGIGGAVAIFWIQARYLAERRALEATMASEQRLSAVGNLAAGVAHEIRNPLNAISIGLQRLRREFAPGEPEAREEYARFTEIIQGEVARLSDIVSRFLSLARPSRLTLTEAPLTPLLEELLTLLESQASGQQIALVKALRLDETRVRMDRPQLTQAFMNLLLNAMQAMPRGGTLRVTAKRVKRSTRRMVDSSRPIDQSTTRPIDTGDFIEIAIADTGPGIPAEHLDRIFEPYFTTKEGGTGLGLALAGKIIQEHQGSIRVENSPGSGAVFTVLLPAVATLSRQ